MFATQWSDRIGTFTHNGADDRENQKTVGRLLKKLNIVSTPSSGNSAIYLTRIGRNNCGSWGRPLNQV